MPATQGYNGTISWETGGIFASFTTTNAKSWSLDYTADMLDTTDFTSTGDRTFIGGLRTWSGSWEMNLDSATKILSDEANLGGTSPVTTSDTLTLTADSGITYSGLATISGVHPSVSTDGLNTVTVDFQGNGPLTIS